MKIKTVMAYNLKLEIKHRNYKRKFIVKGQRTVKKMAMKRLHEQSYKEKQLQT